MVLVTVLAVVSLETFMETGTTFVTAVISACSAAQRTGDHGLVGTSALQLEGHWLNAVLKGDFALTVMDTAQLQG